MLHSYNTVGHARIVDLPFIPDSLQTLGRVECAQASAPAPPDLRTQCQSSHPYLNSLSVDAYKNNYYQNPNSRFVIEIQAFRPSKMHKMHSLLALAALTLVSFGVRVLSVEVKAVKFRQLLAGCIADVRPQDPVQGASGTSTAKKLADKKPCTMPEEGTSPLNVPLACNKVMHRCKSRRSATLYWCARVPCSTLHLNILKCNSDLHNPSSAISLICTFIAICSAWPCLKSPGACGRMGKRR